MLLKFWNYISQLGVNNEMSKSLRQKIVLGNQVGFTSGLLTLLLSFNFRNHPPQALTYVAGFTTCFLFLFFNAINKHYLSRIILLVVLPLLVIAGGYFSSEQTRASQKLSLTILIIVPLVLFGITEKRALIIGLAWSLVCILAYDYIPIILPGTPSVQRIDEEELRLFELISILMNFFVFSLAFIYLQRLNANSEASLNQTLDKMTEQNLRIEDQKSDLERANKKLEILNLRTRINPHFLYNVMNSIQHFITVNDKKSGLSYLTRFSRLMRKYLSYNEEGLITLQEEIELLTNYLDLEKLRFEDKFDYKIEISNEVDAEQVLIPFLMVQPFAENAILHGLVKRTSQEELYIHFKAQDGYLTCTIDDNGVGRAQAQKDCPKDKEKSNGIQLSIERLQLHYSYPEGLKPIVITDKMDQNGHPLGTHVQIKIPMDQL